MENYSEDELSRLVQEQQEAIYDPKRKGAQDISELSDPRKVFTNISKIGAGTYGEVFKATLIKNNLLVAIKTLPKCANYNSVMNEIDLMRKIEHKNIVQYYNSFLYFNEIWIIMEYCVASLSDFCRKIFRHIGDNPRMKIAVRKCLLYFIEEIACGLKVMHARNIIHRDIKNQNVLLTPDGSVKICDFGVAKQNSEREYKTMIGTPHFMAPECILTRKYKESVYTDKADVFSLGTTMHHLLFRKPPDGDRSVKEVMILRTNPKHIIKIDPNSDKMIVSMPVEVINILNSMLENKPEKRPTAAEVQIKISSFVDSAESQKIVSNFLISMNFINRKDLSSTHSALQRGNSMDSSFGGSNDKNFAFPAGDSQFDYQIICESNDQIDAWATAEKAFMFTDSKAIYWHDFTPCQNTVRPIFQASEGTKILGICTLDETIICHCLNTQNNSTVIAYIVEMGAKRILVRGAHSMMKTRQVNGMTIGCSFDRDSKTVSLFSKRLNGNAIVVKLVINVENWAIDELDFEKALVIKHNDLIRIYFPDDINVMFADCQGGYQSEPQHFTSPKSGADDFLRMQYVCEGEVQRIIVFYKMEIQFLTPNGMPISKIADNKYKLCYYLQSHKAMADFRHSILEMRLCRDLTNQKTKIKKFKAPSDHLEILHEFEKHLLVKETMSEVKKSDDRGDPIIVPASAKLYLINLELERIDNYK